MRQVNCFITSVTLITLGAAGPLQAQDTERPIPYPVIPSAQFQQAIESGTRTTAGEPGPNYWQQWTDYDLRVRLLPEEKRVEGSAHIVYHNRSPDALPVVMLHLIQNLHAEGVVRNRPALITGGVEIKRVAVAAQELDETRRVRRADGIRVRGERNDDADPAGGAAGIRPGAGDRDRLGVHGTAAGWRRSHGLERRQPVIPGLYWYPQMAVYDDVVGWQADQFLGNAEFYFGYGSYDMTVEAPDGWVIMGTGELMNPDEVLQPAVLERYLQAHGSDEVVHVLTDTDIEAGLATQNSADGFLSWRFHSDTVRDVAFGATRQSQWDAVRTPVGDRDGDGVTDYALINSFWRSSAPLWEREWEYAAHSIDALSRWTGFAYPWPHMTSVEGGGIEGGGMEYPMMTLMGPYDFPNASEEGLYGLTAHELGHMWFPMIVGTDERRRSWMDEGTTSFNGSFAGAEFWSRPEPVAGNSGYLETARAGAEGEIMRLSDYHYPGMAYGTASYSKAQALLNTLRGLLGKDAFDPAWRSYIRTWAYKHPKPWDFFNFFNSATGTDLDWFWRAWYHETWTLDQAVGSVSGKSRWSTG
jgi:hypothetical protein